jgi:hypothetical protein
MRRFALILPSVALVCLLPHSALAQSRAFAGFDKLKSLAGQWQATLPDGKIHKVIYEVASGGSALVETLIPPDEPSMMSIYHMDGDKLAMTHYCSAGNQPRMLAVVTEADIKSLRFVLVDATNLAGPSDGHMQSLTIRFKDSAHIRHEWTWREGGKDNLSVFDFERKRREHKRGRR